MEVPVLSLLSIRGLRVIIAKNRKDIIAVEIIMLQRDFGPRRARRISGFLIWWSTIAIIFVVVWFVALLHSSRTLDGHIRSNNNNPTMNNIEKQRTHDDVNGKIDIIEQQQSQHDATEEEENNRYHLPWNPDEEHRESPQQDTEDESIIIEHGGQSKNNENIDKTDNSNNNELLLHDNNIDNRADNSNNNDNVNHQLHGLEVPGIEILIPILDDPDIKEKDPIQIIYANFTTSAGINIANMATNRQQQQQQQHYIQPPQHQKPRGIVLLLHACSHSAYKFFSPSPHCQNCVGLSEELRIARLVLQQGYIPIAVTSYNRKSGCWSPKDIPRIEAALQHFGQYDDEYTVYAMGASSGGAFAVELLKKRIVKGALVMVMSLSEDGVNFIQNYKGPKERLKLYLAPMPRDKSTLQHVIQNYHDLSNVQHEFVTLDDTSCVALPVTTEYLMQRVVGMTFHLGDRLISQLKEARHVDEMTNMLIKDPTRSNWREVLTTPLSPGEHVNMTHWLGIYDLRPGISPLAKALHRAWAFHEYCSEVVVPAIQFFEGHDDGDPRQHNRAEL